MLDRADDETPPADRDQPPLCGGKSAADAARTGILLLTRSDILRRALHQAPGVAYGRAQDAVTWLDASSPALVCLDVEGMGLEGFELLTALQALGRRPRVVCLRSRDDDFVPLGRGLEIVAREAATALFRGDDEDARPVTASAPAFSTADFLDLCRLGDGSATLRFTYPTPARLGRASAEIQIVGGEIVNAFCEELSGLPALLATLLRNPDTSLARRLDNPPAGCNVAAGFVTNSKTRSEMMAKANLERLGQIDGFLGACLVDWSSGMVLGALGGGPINVEVAASGNSAVVKAKMQTIEALALDDVIEDILITLHKQYHLIRPLAASPELFLYLALDRKKANLAMARHELKSFEESFAL